MCRSLGEECLGRGHITDKGPEATCAWHERADVSGEGEVSDGGWERHTRGPWRPRGDGVAVGAATESHWTDLNKRLWGLSIP